MQQDDKIFLYEQFQQYAVQEAMANSMEQFQQLVTKYGCAIKEVRTKFEVLNEELSIKSKRKLQRKGLAFTLENMQNELNDVAGVRVICDFVDDIYEIADMLLKQDDIRLISYKDYIREPKPNGYRSYHMIVETPVFFSEGKEFLKVEVQLRTIAMDFWASLEHELKYKKDLSQIDSASISAQLLECATTIADMDSKMQEIKNQIYPKFPQEMLMQTGADE